MIEIKIKNKIMYKLSAIFFLIFYLFIVTMGGKV